MVDLRHVCETDPAFPPVVFVHMGTPRKGEEFFTNYWPAALALGDPQQLIYRQFGIGIGSVRQFFQPGVWKAFLAARSHGIGFPNGNTMRNPGAFLILGGQVAWTQPIEHFGTLVNIAALREVLAKAD